MTEVPAKITGGPSGPSGGGSGVPSGPSDDGSGAGDGASPVGAIVGAIIGALAFIVILVVVVIVGKKMSKKRKQREGTASFRVDGAKGATEMTGVDNGRGDLKSHPRAARLHSMMDGGGGKNAATGALPAGWTEHTTETGETYFYNAATLSTQWHRPEATGRGHKESIISLKKNPMGKGPHGAEEMTVAQFDYTAATADELSFKKGDIITILPDTAAAAGGDSGWLRGQLPSGTIGMFPTNYADGQQRRQQSMETLKQQQSHRF